MSDKSETFEEWKGQKLAKAARQIGKLMGQKILLEQELQAAEEENRILREAVEFYADQGSWCDADATPEKVGYQTIVDSDLESLKYVDFDKVICRADFGGKKARQALEKVGGEE